MIPVNRPLLDGNEAKYLQEAIASGWVSSDGPFVERFEHEFAAYLGRKHAIAVSSGTAALDIAVEALGIGEGDEVIVPTLTIISCINQLLRNRAVPIFVDCDPATWNMARCSQLKRRPKAIMMVHLYGLPVDMDDDVIFGYKIPVIEDASQMLGQAYKGRKCGTLGTISTFSFYANKLVTTGEGGMVVTDDDDLAVSCRSLRNLCHGKERFHHNRIGWNYRMSNLQAAVGCAQLEKIDSHIARKRQMGELYNHLLAHTDVQLPVSRTDYAQNIYWVYPIVVNDRIDNEWVLDELLSYGVSARTFFWPLHLQPISRISGSFPNAEYAAEHGLYLPSGLGTTDEEIHNVVRKLTKFI